MKKVKKPITDKNDIFDDELDEDDSGIYINGKYFPHDHNKVEKIPKRKPDER